MNKQSETFEVVSESDTESYTESDTESETKSDTDLEDLSGCEDIVGCHSILTNYKLTLISRLEKMFETNIKTYKGNLKDDQSIKTFETEIEPLEQYFKKKTADQI